MLNCVEQRPSAQLEYLKGARHGDLHVSAPCHVDVREGHHDGHCGARGCGLAPQGGLVVLMGSCWRRGARGCGLAPQGEPVVLTGPCWRRVTCRVTYRVTCGSHLTHCTVLYRTRACATPSPAAVYHDLLRLIGGRKTLW